MNRVVHLGPSEFVPSPSLPGYSVRIKDDIRKSIVLIGNQSGDDFTGFGTGFFVEYKGLVYLVTAKHIAVSLQDAPFHIRLNLKDGNGSYSVPFDPLDKSFRWYTHPDDNVDVAVFLSKRSKFDPDATDWLNIPESWLTCDLSFGLGDTTYTIGLFRLMTGKKKNLPIVHRGAIALMPEDERIPVQNWDDRGGKSKLIEAYLVEQQSLSGLSGSPVFFRPSLELALEKKKDGSDLIGIFPHRDVWLLGLWQGSWDAKADDVLAMDHGKDVRVPVGMGAVVPASKIIEVLEQPELRKMRDSISREADREAEAKSDSALPQTKVGSRESAVDGDRILKTMLSTPPNPKE